MSKKRQPEDDDPVLAAELNRALAPYKNLVPAEMLAHFRENLRRALTEDPAGKKLLDRVREVERRKREKSGQGSNGEGERDPSSGMPPAEG